MSPQAPLKKSMAWMSQSPKRTNPSQNQKSRPSLKRLLKSLQHLQWRSQLHLSLHQPKARLQRQLTRVHLRGRLGLVWLAPKLLLFRSFPRLRLLLQLHPRLPLNLSHDLSRPHSKQRHPPSQLLELMLRPRHRRAMVGRRLAKRPDNNPRHKKALCMPISRT